jgi:hypothetical protein
VRTGILLAGLAGLLGGCARGDAYKPRNGDIIFHTSLSSQSLAIQKATKSPYSHMGIVYLREGKPFVFEAVQPVKMTPLQDWIRRGEKKKYVVKRLKEADRLLTPEALDRMLMAGRALEGKPYDLTFEWSDDRIYCSELVWKVYKRALNIDIGKPQAMKDFDFSSAAAQAKIKERWGGKPPLEEPVISPVAIYDSPLLTTVYEK